MINRFVDDPLWQRAHEAAYRFEREANRDLWRSAAGCSVIVGKYEEGATFALASEMRKSIATVQDRARAIRVYVSMFPYLTDVSERKYARMARRGLSLSHMVALADMFARYEFEPRCYFDYLWMAYDGRMSSRALRQKVIEEQNGVEPTVRLPYMTWNELGRKLSKETIVLMNDKATQKNKALMIALKGVHSAVDNVNKVMEAEKI
jgi:hypothetical protein